MKKIDMKRYCLKCYRGCETLEGLIAADGHCSKFQTEDDIEVWNGLCAYQTISTHFEGSILEQATENERKKYFAHLKKTNPKRFVFWKNHLTKKGILI